MNQRSKQFPDSLDLKISDLVENRHPVAIHSILDDHGALEGLPFMPEMLQIEGFLALTLLANVGLNRASLSE
jgi:hypothetical protein